MGQATVDLPDPMQPPHSAAGTDELLAQLAGEEIDRLLAEADAERPVGQKPDETAPPQVSSTAPQGEVSPPVQEQATTAAAAADAELSAQLDNLFADLTTTAPTTEVAAPEVQRSATAAEPAATTDDLVGRATLVPLKATLSSPTSDSAPIPEAHSPVHPVEEELRATEALERAGRATASAEAQAQAAPVSADSQGAALAMLAAEASPPLPFYLRPLEWLSAPLDAFPESVRDVVGKVAILTAVNAISVLIYVLLFRRH